MKIQNLFAHDIFRPINGVVKADQLDDVSVWQELDEFVVTRELDKHFRTFFSAYGDAIDSRMIPRWRAKLACGCQGFSVPASRTSLRCCPICCVTARTPTTGQSKRAVEFFESKIQDAMLFGDIKRAVASNTDVILFNIDSKADHRLGP